MKNGEKERQSRGRETADTSRHTAPAAVHKRSELLPGLNSCIIIGPSRHR